MFTVEIRINGALIAHVYGRNTGRDDPEDLARSLYVYEVYRPETRKITTGKVAHRKDDGIDALICQILKNAGKK